VVVGGAESVDVKDKFVPPTVVVGPNVNSKMMQEEIFGPILPILEITSID